MSRFLHDYRRGLGNSARNNALAYGYSVAITASFGVLAQVDRPTSVGRIFLFVLGAGLAFAAVNAGVTRGFTQRVEPEAPVVLALATSIGVISVSASVGIVGLVAVTVGGWGAWLLAPLLSTWAYLGIAALEIAIARALHVSVSDVDPHER